MGAIGAFLNNVKEAYYSIGATWSNIVNLYYDITENATISAIWKAIMNAASSSYTLFVLIFVMACLSVVFFGQKMLEFIKFIFCFVVGFALGVHLLASLLPPSVPIPPWIIGLVVALVVSVLYRFVYIGLYAVSFGYCMYVLCYHGFYLKSGFFTKGNPFICLIVAAVVVTLAFLAKKYIEMLGTAVIGSWAAVMLFTTQLYDFTAWGIFGGNHWVGIFIPMALLSISGMIVQVRTRRRY